VPRREALLAGTPYGEPVTATAQRRAAVLGSPVEHSLSPVLHNAAYQALGLDEWCYTAQECGEDELGAVVAELGPEWVGLSLTMPLKRVALRVADDVSEPAAAIGAANTMLFDRGRRRVENTDAPGMVDALREAGVETAERPVVIGAGGTAQAALAALRAMAAQPATVVVREPARARDLAATAARLGVAVDVVRFSELRTLLASADLVLSTVPKGTVDRFRTAAFAPGAVVFDVVYDPWPTPFAAGAAAAGCRVVSGLDLLLHQAGHQVTLMTGRPAPLAAMRAALDALR
jgi:shikimate dehydrogenase